MATKTIVTCDCCKQEIIAPAPRVEILLGDNSHLDLHVRCLEKNINSKLMGIANETVLASTAAWLCHGPHQRGAGLTNPDENKSHWPYIMRNNLIVALETAISTQVASDKVRGLKQPSGLVDGWRLVLASVREGKQLAIRD